MCIKYLSDFLFFLFLIIDSVELLRNILELATQAWALFMYLDEAINVAHAMIFFLFFIFESTHAMN